MRPQEGHAVLPHEALPGLRRVEGPALRAQARDVGEAVDVPSERKTAGGGGVLVG